MKKANIVYLALFATLSVGLLLAGCSLPSDPAMPMWDLRFMMPISSESYGLDSLLDQTDEFDSLDTYIDAAETGRLRLNITGELASVELAESMLEFNEVLADPFSVALDSINASSGSPRQVDITNEDVAPNVEPPVEDVVHMIFIHELFPRIKGIEPFDSLRYARMHPENGGYLTVDVENNTMFAWDTIRARIHQNLSQDPENPLLGPFIGGVEFTNLEPGDMLSQEVDISGAEITQHTCLAFSGSSPGSEGEVVIIEDDQILHFEVLAHDLTCVEVEALLPAQDPFQELHEEELDQNIILHEGTVGPGGAIQYNVTNRTTVPAQVELFFPNIIDLATGDTLTHVIDLEPDAEYLEELLLENHRITLPLPESEDATQVLTTRATATIQLPDGQFAHIEEDDSVSISYVTNTLNFSELTGLVKDVNETGETESVEVDFWEDQPSLQEDLHGSFAIDFAQLRAYLTPSVNMPLEFELNMRALNNSMGTSLDTTFSAVLPASQDSLIINNVENILNLLPDELQYSYTLKAGTEYFPVTYPISEADLYSIEDFDELQGHFHFRAPFSLTISEEASVHTEPVMMEEPLEGDILELELRAAIENTLPFSGTLDLLAGVFRSVEEAEDALIDENFDRYTVLTTVAIPEPELDPATGRVLAPVVDTLSGIFMNEQQINIFKQDSVYVRQLLRINPTLDDDGNPITVNAYSEDNVTVSFLGQATFRVNSEDDDDEE